MKHLEIRLQISLIKQQQYLVSCQGFITRTASPVSACKLQMPALCDQPLEADF